MIYLDFCKIWHYKQNIAVKWYINYIRMYQLNVFHILLYLERKVKNCFEKSNINIRMNEMLKIAIVIP